MVEEETKVTVVPVIQTLKKQGRHCNYHLISFLFANRFNCKDAGLPEGVSVRIIQSRFCEGKCQGRSLYNGRKLSQCSSHRAHTVVCYWLEQSRQMDA